MQNLGNFCTAPFMINESMKNCLPERGSVSCYISVCLVSFTPLCLLIVEKKSLKTNCLFLYVIWQSIRSLERGYAAVWWYPSTRMFFSPKVASLVSFKFLMPLLELRPIYISLLIISTTGSFEHLLHQFTFLIFLEFFHLASNFLTFLNKVNVAYIKDRYWI